MVTAFTPTAHRPAPSLELIQIASPCTVDWETMQGDDRTRFCGQCNLHVYNLSEMTRDEATTFLASRTGRTCVRMYKRSDGTVLTQDCPVGLAAVRAKIVRLTWASMGLVVAMCASALTTLANFASSGHSGSARFGQQNQVVPGFMAVMGGICPPAPPPAPFVAPPPSSVQPDINQPTPPQP